MYYAIDNEWKFLYLCQTPASPIIPILLTPEITYAFYEAITYGLNSNSAITNFMIKCETPNQYKIIWYGKPLMTPPLIEFQPLITNPFNLYMTLAISDINSNDNEYLVIMNNFNAECVFENTPIELYLTYTELEHLYYITLI